jgi:uncharacterized protein
MKTIQTRTLHGLTVREAANGSGYIGILEGHAAVFNSDSLEFAGYGKPWVERIAPGAFKRTLAEQPDVKALWSHRADAILARSPGTLSLSEDDKGLRVEIKLIDTQQNKDVLASVRAGLVDSMSFGFSARSVKWEEGKERDVRTLLDVDLFEVSPVVWPAYPDTAISARSAASFRSNDGTAELKAIAEERDQHFATARKSTEDATAATRDAIRGMALRCL